MPVEFRVKHASLLAALAAAYPCVSFGAGAANVDFAVGDVRALAADGRSRPLAKGAEVHSGETIDTGNGRAQVRFSDGAQVSLQPQTRFRIDNYRFAGKADGSEKGFFSLLKGGMRTITGLIGRSNRQNYQVNTTVATIGIRGTEYSVTYGNSITVTTGEGSVEICNAAGCMILNSGESGYVASSNAAPVRIDGKTSLPPAQPTGPAAEFAATGEGRNASGGMAPLGSMQSGSGFNAAVAGMRAGSATSDVMQGTASFDASSGLNSIRGVGVFGADGTYAGSVADNFSDGVIGWGRWTTSTFTNTLGSVSSFTYAHYIVGMPTPSTDAAWASGVTATYNLLGFTFPTSTTGVTGNQSVTGSLSVNFGTSTVGLSNLTVPIGGSTFVLNGSGAVSSATAAFSMTPSCSGCGASGSAYTTGFLAGANASRAGLAYHIDTGTSLNDVFGTAAFSRQ